MATFLSTLLENVLQQLNTQFLVVFQSKDHEMLNMSPTEEIFEMYYQLQEPPLNMLVLDCILVIISGVILYQQSKGKSYRPREREVIDSRNQIGNTTERQSVPFEDKCDEKTRNTITRLQSNTTEETVTYKLGNEGHSSKDEVTSVGLKKGSGTDSSVSDISFLSLNAFTVEDMEGSISAEQIPNVRKEGDSFHENKEEMSAQCSQTSFEANNMVREPSDYLLSSIDDSDSTHAVEARIVTVGGKSRVNNQELKFKDSGRITDTYDSKENVMKCLDLAKPINYVVNEVYCSVMPEPRDDKERDAKVICSLVRQNSVTGTVDFDENNSVEEMKNISDRILPDGTSSYTPERNRSTVIALECNAENFNTEYLDFGDCVAAQGVQDAESIQVSVVSTFPELSENDVAAINESQNKTTKTSTELLGSVSSATQYEDCPIEATSARSCCSSDMGFSAVLVELRARLKDKESESSMFGRFNEKDYDYEELLRYDSSEEELIP